MRLRLNGFIDAWARTCLTYRKTILVGVVVLTALALAAHELAAANVPGLYRPERRTGAQPTFEVCFVTDDVQRAFDRATSEGAEEVTPPQTKPWGQDVAYVRDPDGNLVEIASPV